MTCIVGIEINGGKVLIGGDSIGSNGYSKSSYSEAKVFKHSKMIFGYTTSYRFGQILEVLLDDNTLYPPEDSSETYKWLVRVFIPKLKQIIEENGAQSGTALLGINGQLWLLQEDWAVLRPTSGYYSVGSGADFAKGFLYGATLKGFGDSEWAEEVVTNAVETAAYHCPSVGGNVNLVWLEKN